MATPNDPRLQQARRLLQMNQRQQARVLLNAILQDDSRNVEALLLYARVARNAEEQVKVLQRVLKIDPSNAQARTAMERLDEQRPDSSATSAEDNAPRPDWMDATSSMPAYNEPAALSPTPSPAPRRVSSPALVQSSSPDEEGESAGGMSMGTLIALGTLVGAILVIGIIALIALTQGDDEEALAPTNTSVPTNPGILIGSGGAGGQLLAEMPLTWTPVDTGTPNPTLTKAPSATRRPSSTPFPTFTPTEISEIEVTADVAMMSRLYNEYVELAVQASFTSDSDQLASIATALESLITSVNNSNYQRSAAFLPSWREYLDEYRLMVAQQYALITGDETVLPVFEAAVEETEEPTPTPDPDATEEFNLFLVDEADIILPTAENLEARVIQQQQVVEALLTRLLRDAQATKTFEEQVDMLRTPSVTPIVVPLPTTAS